MASILQIGPYQWRAHIRKSGFPTQCKTFESKGEAEAWAADREGEMRRRTFEDRSEAERTTFKTHINRYKREVTPDHKGAE